MPESRTSKAELARELHAFVRARLFGDGPWLVEDVWWIGRQFEEWGLQTTGIGPAVGLTPDEQMRSLAGEDVGPRNRYIYSTPLGRELNVDLMGIFAGYHERGQIPGILEDYGLISQDEMFELYDRWEDGEDLETILRPVVQRVFLQYLETTEAHTLRPAHT